MLSHFSTSFLPVGWMSRLTREVCSASVQNTREDDAPPPSAGEELSAGDGFAVRRLSAREFGDFVSRLPDATDRVGVALNGLGALRNERARLREEDER